ncbi:MAG: IS66 family transposase [Tepidisphaeraceae bacterium]
MGTRPSVCRNCKRLELRLAELERQLAAALVRIAELEGQLAAARKDSSTSSKPPSSDIVKPPPASSGKPGRPRKRRIGGQSGHPRHARPPFPPEQIDHTWEYEWSQPVEHWQPLLNEFRIVQQVELRDKLFDVVEHRAQLYRHQESGRIEAAPLPSEVVRGGLIGPRLSALLAYQKGACHMSYGLIQRFCRDVLELPISTGELAKVVQKASSALEPAHEQGRRALPQQSRLNVDETGHPECGRQLWAWGFHAPGPHGFTWYHIDAARSSEVLLAFLGEAFSGVVGCDYHSAYRKFLRETPAEVQFCWAHLIRDVKFLATLSDRVTRRWGGKLLVPIKRLFRTWHRREEMSAESWRRAADQARRAVLEAVRRPPPRSEAQNVAERFRAHGDQYFTFLELPDVEPTNNAMEQRFRFVAQDRKLTQGTRGDAGQRWCERIWTVLATCAQQGRSAFRFIEESIHALFKGRPFPTLLLQNP